MQSNNKEIYEFTAERTKQPMDLYKTVGELVFSSLYANLRRPQCLIIKLKGVGSWFLRKRRMEIILEYFPPDFDKNPAEFTHPLQVIAYENKVEIYNILKARMIEYEDYIKLRDSIRTERWKTQPLIEPKKQEE